MPSAQKVRWSQLRVGIMAVLALIVLAVLIVLLTGSENPFAQHAVVYTYLNDSAAMTEGAGVRLNGILVGKVKTIELSGENRPGRIVRMSLDIEHNFLNRIPVDSQIGFSAENVLGAKFLNIRRGEAQETIRDGGELKARDDKDFLEVVQSAMPLLDSLQNILNRVEKVVAVVESGQGSIGKLLVSDELYNRLNNTLRDVESITAAVAKGSGTIGRLMNEDTLYRDIQTTLAKLNSVMEDVQRGKGTTGKLIQDPALYDELRKSVTEIRLVIADLNAGKGTAGKLLKDEELHRRMVGTLDKVNTTIDRVNAGEGTLGQLLVNPQLYDNINGLSGEMRALLKDFRANPKKFLTIQLKLF